MREKKRTFIEQKKRPNPID